MDQEEIREFDNSMGQFVDLYEQKATDLVDNRGFNSVEISDITSDTFHMFDLCMVQAEFLDGWQDFASCPFYYKEDAEQHLQRILSHYGWPKDKVRIVPYTEENWRRDLIDSIAADEDLAKKALDAVSTKTLLAIYKGD